MQRVTLTIKEQNKEGKVTTSEQEFTVDKLTFGQILKLTSEVGAVLKELKQNDQLKTVIEGLMGESVDTEKVQDIKSVDDIDPETLEKFKDERFINGIAGAFDQMVQTMPERAEHLISIASGIDVATLRKAYGEEILDVYDAIIEQNDIVRLVNRVKKSFLHTKNQWQGIVQKATS